MDFFSKQKYSLVYIVLLAFVILLPGRVQAITLTPVRQTLIAEPGEQYIINISVKNPTSQTVTATPEVEAFAIHPVTHKPQFGVVDESLGWVEVIGPVTVGPHQTTDIPFQFIIPASAKPQAHYLALFARIAAQQQEGAGVAIQSRIGSLMFLQVAGEIRESLVRERFTFASGWVWNNTNTLLQLQLKNDGNIHVIPTGEIIIKNWAGREILREPINNDAGKILADGRWVMEKTDMPFSWVDIGPITASMHLTYGVDHHTIIDKTSTWYLPMTGIIFGLILFFFIMRFVLSAFFRR